MDAYIANWPSLEAIEVYRLPVKDRKYIVGADPAEGNPTSDDSALTVLDWITGEECAVLAGKYEPTVFATYIDMVGRWYNNAPVMAERNNHGFAVLAWLRDNSRLHVLKGHDDKAGWMSSKLGKALLYTECANHFRLNATDSTKILHSFASYQQLASIEGATLLAPEGQHDDRADSFALAQAGRAAAVDVAVIRQSPVRNRGGQGIVRRSTRRVR